MKKAILATFLALCLGSFARAQQTGAHTMTVTNTAANITVGNECARIQCFAVVVRENSASPTAVFSVTPTGSSTAVNVAAGGSFEFDASLNRNFTPNTILGTIVATTSGPFTFVVIESPARTSGANATSPSSGGGSIGGSISSPFVPFTSATNTLSNSVVKYDSTGALCSASIPCWDFHTGTLGLGSLDVDLGANCTPSCPGFQVATVTLSAAQLISLTGGTTQLTLVPAPGAGRVIVPAYWSINLLYGGTPFTVGNMDNTLIVGWPTNLSSFGDSAMGLLDQTSNQVYVDSSAGMQNPSSAAVNQPIVMALTGTAPSLSGGNGSLVVKIWYSNTAAQ